MSGVVFGVLHRTHPLLVGTNFHYFRAPKHRIRTLLHQGYYSPSEWNFLLEQTRPITPHSALSPVGQHYSLIKALEVIDVVMACENSLHTVLLGRLEQATVLHRIANVFEKVAFYFRLRIHHVLVLLKRNMKENEGGNAAQVFLFVFSIEPLHLLLAYTSISQVHVIAAVALRVQKPEDPKGIVVRRVDDLIVISQSDESIGFDLVFFELRKGMTAVPLE